MEEYFSKPKSFGAVLDQTFRLSKNNFSTFFMIMLIVVGPLILLDALVSLIGGYGLFRDVANGGSFFEQLTNTIDESIYATPTLGESLGEMIVGLGTIVLYPIAQAAIILAIDAQRRKEEYTAGSVIKKAFSRFWPIFASSLLFGVIVFGLIFFPTLLISGVVAVTVMINPIVGIFFGIVLFLAVASVIAFLLTRWGLYLPAVVFERCAPGLGRSWNLTRRNFWRTFGLIVVIGLIVIIISTVFELLFTALLGYSVLYTILLNIITIIATMFFSVGYALIYFDLKLRNDGDDLMDMIDNYETPIQ
ncbi:hypothetical protein [Ornithinibacillus californiensis]|uniref:hypothetical protein n=1 Tax=Ornithinibacillus californiensis TaxID=161536 RepID=UPI00064DD07E|nr:hypothetical protein [Ornithinibacillus californiensis]